MVVHARTSVCVSVCACVSVHVRVCKRESFDIYLIPAYFFQIPASKDKFILEVANNIRKYFVPKLDNGIKPGNSEKEEDKISGDKWLLLIQYNYNI